MRIQQGVGTEQKASSPNIAEHYGKCNTVCMSGRRSIPCIHRVGGTVSSSSDGAVQHTEERRGPGDTSLHDLLSQLWDGDSLPPQQE